MGRDRVFIYVPFDPDIYKSKDVNVVVSNGLNYHDRYTAVGTNVPKCILTITYQENEIFYRGTLPYAIYYDEFDDDVDWEIDAASLSEKKLVKVILNKALPMMGLVLWWSKPFTHVPEIDTQKDILDRKVEKVTNAINKDSKDILEKDDDIVKSDTSIKSTKERE